jgi:uncharacterized membrane protein (DUF373 family)
MNEINDVPGGVVAKPSAASMVTSAYERFEQVIGIVLSAFIAVVILVALLQLLKRLVPLVTGALDPLDHEVFQSLFGMVMTLLIAMEFQHSIIRAALRHQGVIQAKNVLLITLLALSRKFIILDINATGAATIAALAGATLVMGVVYWLLREREDRLPTPAGD